MEALPTPGTAPQASHVGLGPAFIEEDKPPRFDATLLAFPASARLAEVFAILLGGPERLFLYVSPMSAST